MTGYVAGLPAFLSYFTIGLVCFAVFSAIYTRLTPHREVEAHQGWQHVSSCRFSWGSDRVQLAAGFSRGQLC